jgi:hypothetical protein
MRSFKGTAARHEAARQFVEAQLPTYQANPGIKYWEGHNEPVWSTAEEMSWYGQFEAERIGLMAEHGLKCVIGNFATGSPDLALWPSFLSALEAAQTHKALLGLHEYSCPWMWWMTGTHQLNPDEDEGDEGWTTLRYRKIYRQHLIPNGFGDVPLVITEAGVDPLVNPKPPSAGAGGTWKLLGDFWATHDNEPDKADFYFRQLVWYDEELQKDPYVVGATLFTWGSFGGWVDFDVAGTEVAKKLIAYTKNNPAVPFDYARFRHEPTKPGDDDGKEPEILTVFPTADLNVRAEPSLSSARVGGAFFNRPMTVLEEDLEAARAKVGQEGQWISIKTEAGVQGWVAAWFLSLTQDAGPGDGSEPSGDDDTLTVFPTADLNVRAGPSISSARVGGAVFNRSLTVLEENLEAARAKVGQEGQWISVKTEEGVQGWVAAWFVSLTRA